MSWKSETFQKELNWIEDPVKRGWCASALDDLPDYFYEVAASSTGKYHPEYALGDGGLVRHTKAAVTIAHDLLGLEMYGKYTQDEKDDILIALLLHDGMKHGPTGGKWTVFSHPLDMVEFLETRTNGIDQKSLDLICEGISSHMGQWTTDRRSDTILPKPKSALQKFVHQCDYLASRKYLEVNFDKIDYDLS